MREGFDAPTDALPEEDVRALRAFFDRQSRIKLAVWVRHEQRGVDGPIYDHHLAVGVADEDYVSGDMRALELGMELPGLRFDGPTWMPDIFALSEVEALRGVGTVVWQGGDAGDPLDYRFTWEPLDADADARERFAALVDPLPIRSVEAARERLWKGGEEVKVTDQLFVEADPGRDVLSTVHDAARTAKLVGTTGSSSTLGRPRDPRIRTATLYEASA
jgi:hypothetical protein